MKPLTGNFLPFPRKDYGNFNFPDRLFKCKIAHLTNFTRRKSDPLVEAVNLTDVFSKNVVQVQYPSGRESTVSAGVFAPSAKCIQTLH